MFLLYKSASSMIVPPGLFVLILISMAYLAWRAPRRKAIAASLCLFALILYVTSTAAGSLLITGPLETLYKRQLPPPKTDAAILVLAGGSSYDDQGSSVQPGVFAMERVYAAVKLAQSRPGHSTLIMSGGNLFGAETAPKRKPCVTRQRRWAASSPSLLKNGPAPRRKTCAKAPR